MTASAAKSPAILEVPLSELVPSPFNARKHFDREQLAELAGSIRSEGIIQPLLVRIVDGKYEIIAGERRFRAAKLADLDRVPCIIRESDEVEARRKQIIENLQREGIGPIEEAQAFQDLLKAKGDRGKSLGEKIELGSDREPNVQSIAKELGKSKEYVYGRLKLLKLGEAAKKALEAGKIDAGHAVELVPLDEAKQEKALTYIREMASDGETVSVKALRDEIKYSINPPPKPKKSAAEAAEDQKFRERQEKERKEHERRAEAQRKQASLDRLVDQRSLQLLWPKLKTVDAKTSERWIDQAIKHATRDLARCQDFAAGKPIFGDERRYHEADGKAYAKLPRKERLALLALSITLGNLNWRAKENEPTWKWAKIDRKKIAADVAREAKVAAAKAVLNKPVHELAASEATKARRVLSTSAKAKPTPKAKGKARGKAKRKS